MEDTFIHEILDIVIASPLAGSLSKFDVFESEFLDSDHSPIKIIVDLAVDRVRVKESKLNKLNFSKTDWEQFRTELDRFELEDELKSSNTDINSYALEISRHIRNSVDKSTPKLKTCKSQELPKYIIESIKLKRYWKRQFEKTKNLEDLDKYKHLLNFSRFQIKKLKEDKWESFLKGLKNKTPVSTKPFWQKVNKFRKNKESNIPNMMHEGKKLVTDEDKANCFADKYKIVFSNEENPNFDSKFKRETEEFIKNRKYEELFTDKTIKFFYPAELDKVIGEISSKKSLDQEHVCNLMIKKFSEKFKITLLKLFNHCLVNNIIPDEWKKATISMIYKKGCKKLRDNYRPISITSCIAKVFEKLILNRIKSHLNNSKPIRI
jgi:hypothetical protein